MDEKGAGLVEALAALLIVGAAVSVSVIGLSTAMRGLGVIEERVTVETLARSQLDYVKAQDYLYAPVTYATVAPPSPEYTITAEALPLPGADNNIQTVRVTVYRGGQALLQVEDLKVKR